MATKSDLDYTPVRPASVSPVCQRIASNSRMGIVSEFSEVGGRTVSDRAAFDLVKGVPPIRLHDFRLLDQTPLRQSTGHAQLRRFRRLLRLTFRPTIAEIQKLTCTPAVKASRLAVEEMQTVRKFDNLKGRPGLQVTRQA